MYRLELADFTTWQDYSYATANSRAKQKPPAFRSGVLKGSLAMSYFHTGIRTIIGAKSFHGPVRDGKAWGQLAMVARRNWLSYDCSVISLIR